MILEKYYKLKIMKLITSKWMAKLILATVELKLADIISDKKVDINWLAKKTNSKPDLLYRLLKTLAGIKIFKEYKNKHFTITPMGKLLIKEELSSLILMFQSEWHDKAWNKLSQTIKTGIPGFELAHGDKAFTWFEKNKNASDIFNNANRVKSHLLYNILDNYNFKNIKTVTDIGGGYGGLLIQILKKNNHLNGFIYDLPHLQDEIINKINKNNLTNRCEFIKGDFFKKIPVKSDIYILCNILHDWDDNKCYEILNNCYKIMKNNSKILIIEMIIPEKNTFSISKIMDMEVLIMGGGKERTKEEYCNLLNSSKLEIKKTFKKNNYYILECKKTID
jgi:ubiquinone/menaquinone biosynthesis C-methylase UbiE